MSVEAVCVYSCGGIGLVVSCVTRLAAYLVDEDLLPGKVKLLSVPGLLRGNDEEVWMVEELPTIVIDGCADQCGSNFLYLLGIKPVARVYTPDLIKLTGCGPGHSRQKLEDTGQQLARYVARRVADVAQAILHDPSYECRPQRIKRQGQKLCDRSVDVEEALGYADEGGGVYRPTSMPELPPGWRKALDLS